MSEMKPWTGEVVSMLHVNGITQKELSEEMGVTHNYISMILNGKVEPAGIEQRMKDAINQIVSRRSG